MTRRTTVPPSRGTAKRIRRRIKQGGDRVWRFADFSSFPVWAVAQTLSRLARQGTLHRLSKGVYYHSRETALGRSVLNPAALQRLGTAKKAVFPAGIGAANLLGLTTQAPSRIEIATTAVSLPRKLVGNESVIHTRRPEAWTTLSDEDAALLDVLRRGARSSELSPAETVSRIVALCRKPGRFERLIKVARVEPPRVRAILGAIAEAIGKQPETLDGLRRSLNLLSRFDFGLLQALPSARRWQAKE